MGWGKKRESESEADRALYQKWLERKRSEIPDPNNIVRDEDVEKLRNVGWGSKHGQPSKIDRRDRRKVYHKIG